MLSLSRWSLRHRRRVIGLWIVALIGSLALASGLSNHFVNNFTLPGSGAQRANDLLQSGFRAQAGDSDQIVFHTLGGKLTDPSVRATVLPMLSRIARLPHVTGVISPYVSGSR